MAHNMGYVRFENTLADLRDCFEHMGDEGLSAHEHDSRVRLIKLCERIAESFGSVRGEDDES